MWVWLWGGVWWYGYGYMGVIRVPTSLWLGPIPDHNFLMLDHSTVGTYTTIIIGVNYRG